MQTHIRLLHQIRLIRAFTVCHCVSIFGAISVHVMLKLPCLITANLSHGGMSDPSSQGRGFDSNLGPGVVSLSKAFISVGLVKPRNPKITEKLLTV